MENGFQDIAVKGDDAKKEKKSGWNLLKNFIGDKKESGFIDQNKKDIEEQISSVMITSPSMESIINGISDCITGIEFVNIETIEDLCLGSCSTEVYLENYKKILERIKENLIKYQSSIKEEYKRELEKIIESDGRKMELGADNIAIFIEYLLKCNKEGGYVLENRINENDILDLCMGKSENKLLNSIIKN